jgi:uncharacterized membrane protein (UPF0127 family)
VLHLNEAGCIVGIEQQLKPGNIGKSFKGTRSVVEFPAGTLEEDQVSIGQTAIFNEIDIEYNPKKPKNPF